MQKASRNPPAKSKPVRLHFGRDTYKQIFSAALTVILLAALLSLPDTSQAAMMRLGQIAVAAIGTAIFASLLISLSSKSLNSMPATEGRLFAFSMLMLMTAAVLLLVGYAGHMSGLQTEQSTTTYILDFVTALVVAAICYGVILRLAYMKGVELRVRKDSQSANLQALQSRIRPHFMFNSMNSIASLIRKNPVDAEHALVDLADLIRVLMADARKLVPLTAETETCKQYLSIEKLRLGDRLQVHWQIDDIPKGCQIPSLTLQPLLENAVYHGIEPNFGGGIIDIHYRHKDDNVYVSIRNPVPDIGDGPHRKGNKIAMQNIRERLARHYGKRASLSAETKAGIYRTRLRIPVVTA